MFHITWSKEGRLELTTNTAEEAAQILRIGNTNGAIPATLVGHGPSPGQWTSIEEEREKLRYEKVLKVLRAIKAAPPLTPISSYEVGRLLEYKKNSQGLGRFSAMAKLIGKEVGVNYRDAYMISRDASGASRWVAMSRLDEFIAKVEALLR